MSDDLMEEVFEPFQRDHDRLRAEMLAALPESGIPSGKTLTTKSAKGWSTRTSIGLCTSAAIVILAGLAFLGGESQRVYGIEGLQERLLKVKSVHIKGWTYEPQFVQPGQKLKRYPVEYYYERPHRYYSTVHGFMPGRVTRSEVVRDGERFMRIAHAEKVTFLGRADPLQTELSVERNLQSGFLGDFTDIPLNKYRKIGSERVQGVNAVIYEHVQNSLPEAGGLPDYRQRLWIDPATGYPLRYEMHDIDGETKTETPEVIYKTIRFNQPPDPELFSFRSPEGYRVEESDVPRGGAHIGSAGNRVWKLAVHHALNIDNRAVLVCWASDFRNQPLQGKPNDPAMLPAFELDNGIDREDCEHYLLWANVQNVQNEYRWRWSLVMPRDVSFAIENLAHSNLCVTVSKPGQLSICPRPLQFDEKRLARIVESVQKATLPEDAPADTVLSLEAIRRKIAEIQGE